MIHQQTILENYFWLFKSMNSKAKIELINWLSNSLLEAEDSSDELFDCFGTFISDKSVDQQVNEIRNARHFTDKKFKYVLTF